MTSNQTAIEVPISGLPQFGADPGAKLSVRIAFSWLAGGLSPDGAPNERPACVAGPAL
jgi:hypothetical protein